MDGILLALRTLVKGTRNITVVAIFTGLVFLLAPSHDSAVAEHDIPVQTQFSQSPISEKSFDQDMHFMLIEIADDKMYFQVISRTGKTVDSGVLLNLRKNKGLNAA